MAKNVKDFDPNMADREAASQTIWHDARALAIEGQGFADADAPYSRLPARAKGLVTESVWYLGHHSAGLLVRFETDATTISAKWKLAGDGVIGAGELAMNHMPAIGVSGLDLYVHDERLGWRWLAVGRPTQKANSAELVTGLRPGLRTYTMYLPLYNALESLEIGLPRGAVLLPAPRGGKPIVFYGTSITQGGCASRPGMAYTAILGRRLDRPTVNLGFSGSGKAESAMAELLSEIDASAFVIDCLANCVAEDERLRIEPMVRLLRERHPVTPIVLVECPIFTNAVFLDQMMADLKVKNACIRDLYDRLRAEGWDRLHYVEGPPLYGDDGEAAVDGAHATDLGFVRMADAMTPVFKRAMHSQ